MTGPHRTLVDHDGDLTKALTLLPHDDPAARKAIETYIEATDDDAVATELQAWLDRCSDQEIRTDGGTAVTDIAGSHRDVLATIATLQGDHPPTATAIADACGVDDPHIYQILQELDGRGYIDRQRDPNDERIKRSSLTAQGVAVLDALQSQYTALDLDALAKEQSNHPIRTDGGPPTIESTPTDDGSATLGLSLLVDTPTTTVSTDGEATIRVRHDHGDVRIEAAETTARTAEAVLAGLPVAMAALADELSAAAAQATDGEVGDRDG